MKLLFILPSPMPTRYIGTMGWWQELEGSRWLLVQKPPVFAYFSGYILKYHPLEDSVWRIPTSKSVECILILFLGLGCAGTSTLVSGNSLGVRLKRGILWSLPSRLSSHFEHYNVFELR